MSIKQTQTLTDHLFLLSESRGKEASGIVVRDEVTAQILKYPLKASTLIQTTQYKHLFTSTLRAVVGQTRLATNGHQANNRNNQPVIFRSLVAVHNGIIVNDKELWKGLSGHPSSDLDTEVFCAMVQARLSDGYTHEHAIQSSLKDIQGSASIIMLSASSPYLFAVTNTGSLYTMETNAGLIMASELSILEKLLERCSFLVLKKSIHHPPTHKVLRIRIPSKQTGFSIIDHSMPLTQFNKFTTPPKINSLHALQKHIPPYKEIAAMRRCTQCILPETMPFIAFDARGACNFCRTYKKIHYRGRTALESIIPPIKTNSTGANCIVALSGGRDSSYGLHYVKNVLGMKPIAYTYDWGMITDLARRNQARLVGALGVEHIIVSADIDQKRAFVRRNILAWMKTPKLGMVPLFMAGDKQAEYYAEKLRQQTGIPLIFYCRGNELENEEFKFGHCGVIDGTPQGVTHNLSLSGKTRMALYYGLSYLQNPSYINGSLFDILSAYYSMYLMPHHFVYLWHYIPWNEKTIINTLTRQYGWETAPDTKTTWRIDDGTVPFYNYIYYVVQGFTENDTFRSNQIREGILTRAEALQLVSGENRPRYEALAWYFNTLNLNGHEVLSVVDQMPKLYRKNRPLIY